MLSNNSLFNHQSLSTIKQCLNPCSFPHIFDCFLHSKNRISFLSEPFYLFLRICPRRIIIMQFFFHSHMICRLIIIFPNPVYIPNRKIRANFQYMHHHSSSPNNTDGFIISASRRLMFLLSAPAHLPVADSLLQKYPEKPSFSA